jgi:phosphate-selective porin
MDGDEMMKRYAGYVVVFALAVGTSAMGQQSAAPVAPATDKPAEVKAAAVEPVAAGFGKIKLTGLLQGWYQNDESANPEGTFRLRRAEIKLSGEINPEMSWWLMFDPAQVKEDDVRTATGTNLVTSVGRKSVLQDFGVSFKCPRTGVRADLGQYKVPFGMEGLTSSAKLDFIERAALTTQFKWADARDIGLTLRRDLKVGDVTIQPAVGVYNGEGQNRSDANDGKMLVGRLAVSPLKGLHVGVAHVNNEVGAAEVESVRTGFEAKYTVGRACVYGEYAVGESEGKDKETYYVTTTYSVLDDVQLAARYDWYDPNTDNDGDAATETTAGINYFITKHNAKVQLNYVFRGEEGASVDNDIVRANVQVSF